MKLFGSTTSPYVRKVRVYLEETGLPCQFVAVDAWQPSPALLAVAPLGKVPVIERDDGSVLFDSALIIEYLEAQRSVGPPLIASGGEARWRTLRWHALAHGIIDATVVRTLELRRPEALQMRDRMAKEEVRIARALAFIESEMDGRPCLVDNGLTIADLMLGAALGYLDFRYPHDWRSTVPRLAAWARQMHARPSFVKTLPPGFNPPA